MKKTLITLAVAAASVAAQAADTTVLSGQVGYQANFNFGNVSKKGVKIGENIKNGLESSSITSTKIGVNGTEDLGNGITAFFGYEFGIGLTDKIDADVAKDYNDKLAVAQNILDDSKSTDAQRKAAKITIADIQAKQNALSKISDGISSTKKAILGFQGEFGKVTLGKQGGVFGDYTGQANYFNSDSVFGGWVGSDYNFGAGVRYDAPAFVEGVKASLSYDLTQKLVEAGVGFDAYGLNIGVAGQYKSVDGDNQNSYRAGASVGYSNDMFKVGVDYTFIPKVGDTGSNIFKKATHEVGLGVGYNVTDASTLYAGAQIDANVAKEGSNKNKDFQVGLGYEYNVSTRTKAWFETGLDHKGKDSDSNKDAENNFQATVGIRHKF